MHTRGKKALATLLTASLALCFAAGLYACRAGDRAASGSDIPAQTEGAGTRTHQANDPPTAGPAANGATPGATAFAEPQQSGASTPDRSAASSPAPAPSTAFASSTPADVLFQTLTTDQRLGQLFFLEYNGDYALDAAFRKILGDIQPGGLVLFTYRMKSPEQVRALWDELSAASSVPLFAAVDEEGGTIAPISKSEAFRSRRFPGPKDLLSQGVDAVEADAREKALFLRDLGFNLNFAPVADVVSDKQAALYARSYGEDPETVARAVAAAVRGHVGAGVGATVKHFPGSGDSRTDTHKAGSEDDREMETLLARDLPPFHAGVNAGALAVMLGHVTLPALDAQWPASLSPAAYALARERFGDGVLLVTDSLQMKAVAERFDRSGDVCVQALRAGADMVLMPDAAAYAQVREALGAGELTVAQVEEKALRVLRAKERLGLAGG